MVEKSTVRKCTCPEMHHSPLPKNNVQIFKSQKNKISLIHNFCSSVIINRPLQQIIYVIVYGSFLPFFLDESKHIPLLLNGVFINQVMRLNYITLT